MKKLLLILLVSMALLVGCSQSQEQTEQDNTVSETGMNEEYINQVKEIIENTMSYESIDAKITVKESENGLGNNYSKVLISKNPNMGLITTYSFEELSSANLYIEDGNIIANVSLMPSMETGELEMQFQPIKYNTLFTVEDGFTDKALTFANLVAMFEVPENIKSIEKTETGYVYEVSEKYFEDLLKIQVEVATEQLETVPEEMRGQFELMIDMLNSQERQTAKVTITVEDSKLVRQEADSSMYMAQIMPDGTLTEEKTEMRSITDFEIIRINDNENIQNEILAFYEEYNK